jgi:hypothetical protein
MTEKQVQTRAARRQAMVKERRNVHRQRYDRNKREMMIIKGISIALALIVLGALGFAAFNWAQDRNLNRAPEGVKTFQYAQGNHIEGNIDYSAQAGYQGELPPAGGAHNSTAQQCDVYTQPIRQENAIHSLEHGAVWITYQPDLAADQVTKLDDIVKGDPYLMVSPYPGSPAPIVLTAWNHQLQLQSYDKDTIEQFIRSYKNKQGVTPEFGASCAGTTATAP